MRQKLCVSPCPLCGCHLQLCGGRRGAQLRVVVVSPGVWARALGRLAGVHVPLVGMHHAYVVTERIEGIQVSPARLQLGSSALGDRAGEAERPLTLSGTPRPVGPPHSCQARLCSWGSAHPQQGWQTTLNRVRFNI